MQVFIPYPSPLKVAECLDNLRLNKQIIEAKQIINAIGGVGGWSHHPVVKMYEKHIRWLSFYVTTLEMYQKGNFGLYVLFDEKANEIRPDFITDELCDQHKRRLYTKAPALYPEFAYYGTSEENWYVVNGEIVKYINGKRI